MSSSSSSHSSASASSSSSAASAESGGRTVHHHTGKKRQRVNDTHGNDNISAEEAKLEALLFGNDTARKESKNTSLISSFSPPNNVNPDDDDDEKDHTFPEHNTTVSSSHHSKQNKPSAWNDDDDDNVNINISNKARLRKLRTNHDETYIRGTDYSQRLKDQFHKLHSSSLIPSSISTTTLTTNTLDITPAWAKGRTTKTSTAKPKTKTSNDKQQDDSPSESESEHDDDNDDDEEVEENLLDEVLRDTTSLADRTNRHHQISPGTLSISRLRDANITDPCRSVVQASEFHPVQNTSVLFTASFDHRLRFFSIDGKRNTRLASVYFPDLPIASASWTGDGNEVICTGRRSYFYTYDINAGKAIRIPRIIGREEKSLESCIVSPSSSASDSTNMLAFLGNSGTVILCSNRTKQWIGNLKMEGNVRSACFTTSPNNEGGVGALEYPELLTVGTSGMVYRWDLRTLKCIHKHIDEGSIGSTCIAAAWNGQQYAVGSTSGIVNIYNTYSTLYGGTDNNNNATMMASSILSPWSNQTISPLYTINNLTTSIRNLRYNYDSSILGISSQAMKDSLKLVHTASGTVFSNWPTDRTPLHYVTSIGFSRSNEYLQVGNDRGRVLLYRVNAYS